MYKCYLAGPFFNKVQKRYIKNVEKILDKYFHTFSPSRDGEVCGSLADKEERQRIFELNCTNIDDSDLVVVVLDWLGDDVYQIVQNGDSIGTSLFKEISIPDTGSIFEVGYAYKCGIPIVGLVKYKEALSKVNLMLTESMLGVASFSRLKDFCSNWIKFQDTMQTKYYDKFQDAISYDCEII